jgi:hypothetical protein
MKRVKRGCRVDSSLLKEDLPKSVDLCPDRRGIVVLNQGERSSCCAHAVSAVHVLTRGEVGAEMIWEDIHDDKWEDSTTLHPGNKWIGALIKECADKVEEVGQRMRRSDEEGERYWRMRMYPIAAGNVISAKKRLAAGQFLACAFEIFRAEETHLTAKNHRHLEDEDRERHAVAVVGYRDDVELEGGGAFFILNSHGIEWGELGFGTVSFEF